MFVGVSWEESVSLKQMRSLAMWSSSILVRSQGSPSWKLHAQCDGRAKGAVEIGDKSALETTRLGQAVSHWNWSGSCDAGD